MWAGVVWSRVGGVVRYGVVVVVGRPIRRSHLGAAHMHALADTHTHSQTHARTRRHTHALLDTHTHSRTIDRRGTNNRTCKPAQCLYARPCYTHGHATRTAMLHTRSRYTHGHATRTAMLHTRSRYTR